MGAILIVVVAGAVAGWLGRVASRLMGDTPSGRLAATALPVPVMAIAVFMILNQLKIASDIVTITYAALMGAVAPGMALEFGLGGRDVASCMLEDAYRRGQDEPGRLRGRAAAQRAASAETARMPTGPGRSPTAT